MKLITGSLAFALAMITVLSTSSAGPKRISGANGPKYIDGKVTYKFAGVDGNFDAPADACKAGIDDLAKHGNKKTFDSVKEGSSSTTMTCVVLESDGKTVTELGNTINMVLECPDTTSPRSTDNSGDFSKMRCHCDDAKKGCPATPKK